MRIEKISHGEWYHLYNRAVDRKEIFLNERDYVRFLFILLHLQYTDTFYNIERQVDYFVKHRVFNISYRKLTEKQVEIATFCIMPNHFHIMAFEKEEGGISRYMQRVLNAYSKYFNTKYKKSGHVFGGPYHFVHVKNNNQLLYLSGYIHNNPRELKKWSGKEVLYPYSSYQDYIGKNRWDDSLSQSIILEQFENKNSYKKFLIENPAKESPLNIDSKI